MTGWRTEDAMTTWTETGPRAAAIQETDLVIQEDFPRIDHPQIGEKAGEDSEVVAKYLRPSLFLSSPLT